MEINKAELFNFLFVSAEKQTMGPLSQKLESVGLTRETLAVVSAGASAVLGFLAVLGWHAQQPTLIQAGPIFAPFAYSAALAFFLSGMAFLAVLSNRASVTTFFSSLAIIAAFYAVFREFAPASSMDLKVGATMAPVSCLCFVLINISFMIGRRGGAWGNVFQGLAGAAVFAFGSSAFFGYLTDLTGAYTFGESSPIAVQATIGFLMLGAGLITFSWTKGGVDWGFRRRAVAWEVGFGMISATLMIWQALSHHGRERFDQSSAEKALSIRNELASRINLHLGALVNQARAWELDGFPDSQSAWEKQAGLLTHRYTFRAVAWITPGFELKWASGRKALLTGSNLKFPFAERSRLAEASRQRRATLVRPLRPGADIADLQLIVPLRSGGATRGYFVGEIHLPDTLDYLLQDNLSSGFALTVWEGRAALFRREFQGKAVGKVVTLNLATFDRNWAITVGPSQFTIDKDSSHLPGAVLALGLLVALLVTAVLASANTAALRAVEAERANFDLRHEITERRRVQKELVAASHAALQAAQAKSDFLANMSHEIRTPLNAVIGMSQILAESKLAAGQKEQLKTIRYSADALLTLINDILDFSKIEAGKLELENMGFDLRELVEATQGMLGSSARTKKLKLEIKIDGEVPRFWRGDPGRLRQILVNLVNNAIKFTEKGKVSVQAKRVELVEGDWLRFEVTDTGIGIAEETRPKLFSVFSQADTSTTRKYGGTGLGLSICKRLVDLMGGRIGFESKLGKGTTFWFQVPWSPERLMSATKRKTAKKRKKKAFVLVAEDSPINQTVTVKMLESLGHKCRMVSDGAQALVELEKREFDAVFMDCQMPGMDGYEATRRLRAGSGRNRHTPVIALTAHAFSEDRERCFAAGMSDFLTKPVEKKALQDVLDRWNGGEIRLRTNVLRLEKARPAHSESPLLDHNVLNEVRSLAGDDAAEFMSDMAKMFDMAKKEMVLGIQRAAEKKDGDTAAQAAHKFKSAAGNLGAVGVSELCKEIELAAKNEEFSRLPDLIARLEDVYAATYAELTGSNPDITEKAA